MPDALKPEDSARALKDLILGLARALVEDQGAVEVEARQDGTGTTLSLRVARSDVGKVIGKQGRTARSLRVILAAASIKQNHRFSLDIINEPPTSD